jgi:energy-converting hydrogenase A subunit M
MKENSLLNTNRYLKDSDKAQRMITRSIASSIAIETGESIAVIEQKINRLRSNPSRIKLA